MGKPLTLALSLRERVGKGALDVHFVNPSPVFLLDKAGDGSHSYIRTRTVLSYTS